MSHSDRGPVRLTCREPMDFDPLHLDVVPPKSQSTVDIRAAYSEIVPQALAAIGNLIADDHRYTSNEEGHLAWDVSLLVRAVMLSVDQQAAQRKVRTGPHRNSLHAPHRLAGA